jgi:hypothetical protein
MAICLGQTFQQKQQQRMQQRILYYTTRRDQALQKLQQVILRIALLASLPKAWFKGT